MNTNVLKSEFCHLLECDCRLITKIVLSVVFMEKNGYVVIDQSINLKENLF